MCVYVCDGGRWIREVGDVFVERVRDCRGGLSGRKERGWDVVVVVVLCVKF